MEIETRKEHNAHKREKVGGGGEEEYKMLLFASQYSTSTRWVVVCRWWECPDTNKQTDKIKTHMGTGTQAETETETQTGTQTGTAQHDDDKRTATERRRVHNTNQPMTYTWTGCVFVGEVERERGWEREINEEYYTHSHSQVQATPNVHSGTYTSPD